MKPGELDLTAKLRFARQAVLAQITGLPSLLRAYLTDGPSTPMLMDREPPDTPLTRAIVELTSSSYPEPLLGHCLRTYLWADLLGTRDGLTPDREILYVAALLHDIALTDRFRPDASVGCFAVHGGDVARTTLESLGASPSYASEVSTAIRNHMDISVPREVGAAAYLLHAGAHLDVAGTRAGDLPRQTIRAVIDEHPRDGFAACFATLMRRESIERPNSRAALLWHLGMRVPLNRNPVDRSIRVWTKGI